jgi:uncharacterized protein
VAIPDVDERGHFARMTFTLTNKQARTLLLNRQGLARDPRGDFQDDDLLSLIHSLGYVQLDSINTVERAHHMILHSRADGYKHAQLKRLHEDHKSLFEHWTHDACLIPSEFYPHWRHRFQATKRSRHTPRWNKRLGPNGAKVVSAVRSRIKKEGPLMSRDFEDKGQGAWWGWGPSKTALEYLWRTGELSIAKREGFQKVYDLSERTIDPRHRDPKPTLNQTIDWKCREALNRLGAATPGEIAAYWASVPVKMATEWAKAGLKKDLIDVMVTAADGTEKKAVAFNSLEDELAGLQTPQKRLRFLSPFDPVIRDRKRTKRLFDFDYTVEIFVPEAKRQYGYYVLPILEGTNFTGRADLKVHRKEGRLEMKGLWLEPGVKLGSGRASGIRQALSRLAKFTGATSVEADAALQRAEATPTHGR